MKKIPVLFIAAIWLISCNSPKEKSLDAIRNLEASDSTFSPENIESLKKQYIDYADKYPDDDLAPEFLFKAGQRCNVMAQHEEALAIFQKIRDTYPKHHMAEEALFLQGYIYENSLHNEAKAKEIYTAFIQQYPKSELAEDAQLAIQNLGKSPEEILESFNK